MSYVVITFLVNIAIWGLGYFTGVMRARHQMSARIVEDPDRILGIINKIKQENEKFNEENFPTEILIEERDSRFFVYNKETSLFLGQGDSIDDAMDTVCKRFPNIVFVHEDEQSEQS